MTVALGLADDKAQGDRRPPGAAAKAGSLVMAAG
jgi:hypothetical protein